MRVWNKKTEKPPKDAVYIGRPSRWGNPFSMRFESQRPFVIQRFREWLDQNPQIKEEIRRELRGKDLVCFCFPKACHGDIILEIANAEEDSVHRN
jgi:hypothetical protein